jgi:hypothetical protein
MYRVQLTSAVKLSPAMSGDIGQKLILTREDAYHLVGHNLAVWVDREDTEGTPGPTRAELEAEEEKHGTLSKIGEETSQSDSPDEPEETEPEEVKRPYGNAPKSAWIRYACAVDEKMTQERGEGLTKAELMSKYGERL